MFDETNLIRVLGLVVIAAPALLMTALGLSTLVGRPFSERVTSRLAQTAIFCGLVAALGILAFMLARGPRRVPIELGNWIHLPDYHFNFKFLFDRLSIPLVILTFLLCGTIGAFTTKYLHREPGYNRFFALFALFLLGMICTSLAGTIETLFFGWELVGISSALLVAYYHERQAPVRNGLRVWCVYRISDAALLTAAVLMHHLTGEGDFDTFMGGAPWPDGQTVATVGQATAIGLLLLLAAAGKSALVPFSGWLPRAMEGPTPSSAVFYGALSVHLGAFLLLRAGPLIDASWILQFATVSLGLLTALFATLAGRVQTDIKSALSFASLTQVGLIVAEIGLGFRYLALTHLIGHACLRMLQLVRAPSLLLDYHALENAIGEGLPRLPGIWGRIAPGRLGVRLYRLAMERGFLDALLNDFLVNPFLAFFRWCDGLERRWTDFLSGGPSRESDRLASPGSSLDDLT